jgi:hypothetical protein
MGVHRDAMDRKMGRSGLAPRTRKTYLGCMARLARLCRRPPDAIEPEDLEHYGYHLADERHRSASSRNQVLSAAKVLFKDVIKRGLLTPGEVMPHGQCQHSPSLGGTGYALSPPSPPGVSGDETAGSG